MQQTVTGFGFSLILMPTATLLLGLKTAAPLVALQGLMLYIVNLTRCHYRVVVREALPLSLAAMVGVPIGIWLLVSVNAKIVMSILALILILNGLHALKPSGFFLRSNSWGPIYGFVAGCLMGAYNVSGPVVVLCGTLRKWEKEEFRLILQLFFSSQAASPCFSTLSANG